MARPQDLGDNVVTQTYDIGDILGKGAFSIVRRGVHKTTAEQVAIKILKTPPPSKFSERHKRVLENEIAVMRRIKQKIDHRNVLQMIDVHREKDQCLVVMECCEGGELFDRIVAKQHYDERCAAELLDEIISGLETMHAGGIVHRDIKPENLLYKTKAEDAPIKIMDFGLAMMDGNDVHKSIVGTPGYVAPEVLISKTYTTACDVWSTGVVLYILLVGYPPFWGDSNAELFAQIKSGYIDMEESEGWSEISKDAKDLVLKMLTHDPESRPTLAQVRAHPWMSRHAKPADENVVPGRGRHMLATVQRMSHFNARRKFKAMAHACMWGATFGLRHSLLAVLGSVKAEFSKEELDAVYTAFRKRAGKVADAGPKGGPATLEIDREDFFACMRELGHGRLPLEEMFGVFDTNANGRIDFKEFVGTLAVMGKEGEEAIRLVFSVYDRNGNGFIEKQELVHILSIMASRDPDREFEKSQKLAQIFERLDTNHDGHISFEEFKTGIMFERVLVDAFLARSNAGVP
jgi:calcium-dependent protein kinase